MSRLFPEVIRDRGLVREVFIETGTGGGMSVRRCRRLFSMIHTIESDLATYQKAAHDLRTFGNVRCHHGRSPDLLRRIIDPKLPTLFYLDAHAVAQNPELPAPIQECPLLDELRAIFSFSWSEPPPIMVDDAGMYGEEFWSGKRAKGYDRAQWPTLAQVLDELPAGYRASNHRDILILEPQ